MAKSKRAAPKPRAKAAAAAGGRGPRPAPPRRRRGGLLAKLLIAFVVLVFVFPVGWVLVYRLLPPPATSLMLIRLGQGKGMDYRWRPLSKISPAMVQAAVAAEDARFCDHDGFDFQAMEKAMASNQRRPGKIRGGSTISQQVAKNVFLWPDRSYLRKGLEAYFTVLIEKLWGKRRIMEVYLNVVEMGPGIYGAQAAAERYFHVDAARLSPVQASRLAAVFPNPLKWKAAQPGAYVRKRSRRIGGAIGTVRNDGLAACVGRLSRVAPAELPQPVAPPSGPAPLPRPSPAPSAEPEAPAPEASEPPPAAAPLDGPADGVADGGQSPAAAPAQEPSQQP